MGNIKDTKRVINGKKTIPQGRKMLNPQRRKMIRLKNVAKRGMITVALIASVVGFNLSKNNKDNFVSNFNEIEQYNISSSELNLSQDSLEQAQKLYEEIESLDMSTVSNIELASYFEQISDMQLDLMKEKVSNLIGKRTYDFTLVAPSKNEDFSHTRVCDENMELCLAQTKSSYIDDIMQDILKGRRIAEQMVNGNINRKKSEKELIEMANNLPETAALKLTKDKKGRIEAYYIETKELTPDSPVLAQSEVQSER